jgi:hypothetical protein
MVIVELPLTSTFHIHLRCPLHLLRDLRPQLRRAVIPLSSPIHSLPLSRLYGKMQANATSAVTTAQESVL